MQDINLARKIVAHQAEMSSVKFGVLQVMLGVLNYETAYNKLPTNFRDRNGNPLLSWRVAVLPFIGERELYRSFKLDQPWDSEHNKPLIEKMPRYFQDPFNKSPRQQKTRIQCLSGKDSGKFSNAATLDDVKDGANNSIAIVTADIAVPWTKPTDHAVNLDKPWSNLSESPIVGLFDGSTVILSKPDQEQQLRAGLTIAADDGGVEYKSGRKTSQEISKIGKARLHQKFGPLGLSEKVAEFATQPSYLLEKSIPPAEAMEIANKFIQSKRSRPDWNWATYSRSFGANLRLEKASCLW